MRKVRFRTLGCYPLTGAIDSEADTIEKIVEEMMTVTKSERTTRVIDLTGRKYGAKEKRRLFLSNCAADKPYQISLNPKTLAQKLIK